MILFGTPRSYESFGDAFNTRYRLILLSITLKPLFFSNSFTRKKRLLENLKKFCQELKSLSFFETAIGPQEKCPGLSVVFLIIRSDIPSRVVSRPSESGIFSLMAIYIAIFAAPLILRADKRVVELHIILAKVEKHDAERILEVGVCFLTITPFITILQKKNEKSGGVINVNLADFHTKEHELRSHFPYLNDRARWLYRGGERWKKQNHDPTKRCK
jgi:hypothetical protein